MRAVAVFYILGWILAAVAAAMLVPAVFAAAIDSVFYVQAFAVPAFAVGFLAGCLIIAFKSREAFSGRRHSLLLLALVWIAVPAAAALPFYTADITPSALTAYFEAVSGFTTTGATVLSDLSDTPASIIVWRALLQWLGGLTTLIALAALLGPLSGTAAFDRQLLFFGQGAQGAALHMREALASITPLYTSLTAACFVALSISGLPAFDAFCLSLSTLSTGGFMPRDGAIVLYGAPFAQLTLAVFMIIGAVSVIWIRAILQMRWPLVRETREPRWIALAITAFGIVLGMALVIRSGDYSPAALFDKLTIGLASAASIMSTSGFPVSAHAQNLVPYMALLGLCIIGGGRFSTAGGLKVYRFVAVLRQVGRELRLLVFPHGVRPSRYGAESLDTEVVKAIWVTLSAFMLAIGLVAMLVASSGVPFAGAMLAAAGSVSNMGPVYDIARAADFPNAPTYAQMGPVAHIALCAGMILGRVEILALLVIFNVTFWRD